MPRTVVFETLGSAGEKVGLSIDMPDGHNPCPTVLLVHGFKGFKDWGFFPTLGRDLALEGIACVRVNTSHNGTGRGHDSDQFVRMDLFEQDRMSYRLDDVAAAWKAARSRFSRLDNRLAIFGHSVGGAVALLSSATLPLMGLVSLGTIDKVRFPPQQEEILHRDGRMLVPNRRTGQLMPVGVAAVLDIEANEEAFNMEARAKELQVPWLLFHGTADDTVPCEASQRLAALAGSNARYVPLEGTDHVCDCSHPMKAASPAYETMRDETVAFLDDIFFG